MIIPGLTDVDLSDMASMSIEQLEDLEHLANERAKEFQMQLEALHSVRGVSKEHANQFKGILPSHIALESFTGQVTNTNYTVACEALSTAVKLAIGVAIVASLGAVIYFATRTSRQNIAAANAKMEEIYNKVEKERKEFEEDLKKHKEATEAASQAAAAVWVELGDKFVASRPNNYLMGNMRHLKLFGKAPGENLHAMIGKLKLDIEDDYRKIVVPAIDAVIKFSHSGKPSELGIMDKMDVKLGHSGTLWNADLFSKYVKEQIHTLGGKIVNVPADPVEAAKVLRDWAEGDDMLSEKEQRELIISTCKSDTLRLKVPPFKDSLKQLDEVIKLSADLPKQEKRLEEVTVAIPPDFKGMLNKFLDHCKQNIQTVEVLIGLINLEVQTYNRLALIVGKASIAEVEAMAYAVSQLANTEESSDKIKATAQRVAKELKTLKQAMVMSAK